MTTPSSGPSGSDNPQVNLGGADAVDKTSYVTGRGTDPEDAHEAAGERRHAPRSTRPVGMSPAGWAMIAVAVLIAAFFGFALFR